jgi:hypothetical protein
MASIARSYEVGNHHSHHTAFLRQRPLFIFSSLVSRQHNIALTSAPLVVALLARRKIMSKKPYWIAYTVKDRGVGPLPPVKYGDERDMLEASLPIVEALYRWINGTSLSFQDSREIDRKNAKALWEACTFNINLPSAVAVR